MISFWVVISSFWAVISFWAVALFKNANTGNELGRVETTTITDEQYATNFFDVKLLFIQCLF